MDSSISRARQPLLRLPALPLFSKWAPGKLCGTSWVGFLLYEIAVMSPSWGGMAQGRYLTSVGSIPLHLPANAIHTQEKYRHLSMRKRSLYPSTFLLSSPPSQASQRCLLPLSFLPTSSPSQGYISRKPRNLQGNQSSSSQPVEAHRLIPVG